MDYLISIPYKNNLNKFVWNNHTIKSNFVVDSNYKIFTQEFTIPMDENVWFVQPKIHFDNGSTFYIDNWSLKQKANSQYTEEFLINLNNEYYYSDILLPKEFIRYCIAGTF